LIKKEFALMLFKEFIWNKNVSFKVSLFMWSLLNIRILTKDNLVRREFNHLDFLECSWDCEKMKELITFTLIAMFSTIFGTLFLSAFGFLVTFRGMIVCMLCYLVHLICLRGSFHIASNLIGWRAIRSFENREIWWFLVIKKCHKRIWLILLNFMLGGGWRLKIIHYFCNWWWCNP